MCTAAAEQAPASRARWRLHLWDRLARCFGRLPWAPTPEEQNHGAHLILQALLLAGSSRLVFQYRAQLPAADLAVMACLVAAALWLALPHRASSLRSAGAAVLKLYYFFAPMPCHVRLLMAHHSAGWSAGSSWRAWLGGTAAVAFCSRVPQLTLFALLEPASMAVHVPMHVAGVLAAMRHNKDVCSSPLLTSPGARLLLSRLRSLLEVVAQAVLLLPMPSAASTLAATDECEALLTFLLWACVLLLPSIVLLRQECARFRAYCRSTSAEQQQADAACFWLVGPFVRCVLGWLCKLEAWQTASWAAAGGLAAVIALLYELSVGLKVMQRDGGSWCGHRS